MGMHAVSAIMTRNRTRSSEINQIQSPDLVCRSMILVLGSLSPAAIHPKQRQKQVCFLSELGRLGEHSK